MIDAGSGSGLLAMFAARAGADLHVTAIERSAHMTDVGEEIACVNGFAGAIHCLHRDARHVRRASLPGAMPLNGALKPDGVPTEMQKKADMMVYEIFDSGLIARARCTSSPPRARGCSAKITSSSRRARGCSRSSSRQRFGETEVELGGFDDDSDAEDESVTKRETFVFDFSHANRWRWREEFTRAI